MNLGDQQYELTDKQFGWVINHVKDRTGINLTESKRNLVYNRLASRIRLLRLDGFDDYFQLLESNKTEEFEEFLNAITTNVTSFFRENHHFEYLAEHAIPESMAVNAARKRIRIWSAGCSKGMEPYSIAMVLKENLPQHDPWDAKILATDLDTKVLAIARSGVYDDDVGDSISEERRRRFVLKGTGDNEGSIRMRRELQDMVSFRHLNLMEDWPVKGPFDVIFCRNVVIYFDRPTQEKLWSRFGALVRPGGYLIVGHSESMLGDHGFQPVGRTMYKKGTGDG